LISFPKCGVQGVLISSEARGKKPEISRSYFLKRFISTVIIILRMIEVARGK
jgi:hypothetical protein